MAVLAQGQAQLPIGLRTSIAEVTKFAHDVHERVAKLEETSPTVETLVNFVRDLMERVAKIEQNLTPLKDALEFFRGLYHSALAQSITLTTPKI